MAQNCRSCGAAMKKGSYICEYCGTDWTPDELRVAEPQPTVTPGHQSSEQTAKAAVKQTGDKQIFYFVLSFMFCGIISLFYMWFGTDWKRRNKVLITALTFALISPILVYGFFFEIVYAVKGDTPKVNSLALPSNERIDSLILPQQVQAEIFDHPKRSLNEKKKIWRDQCAEKWVRWAGQVTQKFSSDSSEYKMTLKSLEDPRLTMTVFFNPKYKEKLDELATSDTVIISGRLWGLHFMANDVILADGYLEGRIGQESTENPPTE